MPNDKSVEQLLSESRALLEKLKQLIQELEKVLGKPK